MTPSIYSFTHRPKCARIRQEVKPLQPKLKIVIEENRVSLDKGSESIWIDISPHRDEVYIQATSRNGGYTVARLRFTEDEVVMREAST
jgi:hypothetical protein